MPVPARADEVRELGDVSVRSHFQDARVVETDDVEVATVVERDAVRARHEIVARELRNRAIRRDVTDGVPAAIHHEQ